MNTKRVNPTLNDKEIEILRAISMELVNDVNYSSAIKFCIKEIMKSDHQIVKDAIKKLKNK